jgi:hypothetical protein
MQQQRFLFVRQFSRPPIAEQEMARISLVAVVVL